MHETSWISFLLHCIHLLFSWVLCRWCNCALDGEHWTLVGDCGEGTIGWWIVRNLCQPVRSTSLSQAQGLRSETISTSSVAVFVLSRVWPVERLWQGSKHHQTSAYIVNKLGGASQSFEREY